MSEPQHMVALHRANQMRIARAALHREIASLTRVEGEVRVADLLRQSAYEIESADGELIAAVPITEFIGWVRRRSEAFARRSARELGLVRVVEHYGLTVDDLTVREALALADALCPTTVTKQEQST